MEHFEVNLSQYSSACCLVGVYLLCLQQKLELTLKNYVTDIALFLGK